jgi:hypothetical protein
MFLDTSALYLLERHRAFEAELERDGVLARHRADIRSAKDASVEAMEPASGGIASVVRGDRQSGGRGLRPDLGRAEHLDPAPCAEQHTGRFIRPVQP